MYVLSLNFIYDGHFSSLIYLFIYFYILLIFFYLCLCDWSFLDSLSLVLLLLFAPVLLDPNVFHLVFLIWYLVCIVLCLW